MLLVEGSSETRLFKHLSKNVFWNPQLPKYVSYEGLFFFFFESVQNSIYILEMQKKIKKKPSVL